jgi:hypothetical protein
MGLYYSAVMKFSAIVVFGPAPTIAYGLIGCTFEPCRTIVETDITFPKQRTWPCTGGQPTPVYDLQSANVTTLYAILDHYSALVRNILIVDFTAGIAPLKSPLIRVFAMGTDTPDITELREWGTPPQPPNSIIGSTRTLAEVADHQRIIQRWKAYTGAM